MRSVVLDLRVSQRAEASGSWNAQCRGARPSVNARSLPLTAFRLACPARRAAGGGA